MKVLFLDCDGVIGDVPNPPSDLLRVPNSYDTFCPELVENINLLCKRYNLKIVVSSTWRIGKSFQGLVEKLRSTGIKGEIVGVTDNYRPQENPNGLPDSQCIRGIQISRYLDRNPQVAKYIVLDDSLDAEYGHTQQYVRVDGRVGFNDDMLSKCIARFDGYFLGPYASQVSQTKTEEIDPEEVPLDDRSFGENRYFVVHSDRPWICIDNNYDDNLVSGFMKNGGGFSRSSEARKFLKKVEDRFGFKDHLKFKIVKCSLTISLFEVV